MPIIETPSTGRLDLDALAEADYVAFNVDGALPPLVLVRTWSTEIPHQQRLARHLGPDQPIISIGHPIGETHDDYPDDIGEWRDFCLERLAAIDVADPIWIGGWSFGGVVALEMARTLVEQGRDVAQIVMLDTRIPKMKARRGLAGVQSLGTMLQEYSMFPTKEERSAYMRKQVRHRARRHTARAGRVVKRLTGRAGKVKGDIDNEITKDPLVRAIWICYLKYRTRRIDLPVMNFWTEQSRGQVKGDATLGWSLPLYGDIQLVPIPGEHLTMFDKEHIEVLACRLASTLEQARVRDRVALEEISPA